MALNVPEALTLLYYAGYLSMTVCHLHTVIISVLISVKLSGQFKIPNLEVMNDWARWITDSVTVKSDLNILDICVEGHVETFAERWPNFMQQNLDPKTVAKLRGTISNKTPERIYRVYFLGLMHSLRCKGWDVSIESRGGGGYIDIRLISKTKSRAILIKLKSSQKQENIRRDAREALQQIIEKNYRNPEGLPNIRFLREYGIAAFHLDSCVEGRYLELDARRQWVEKDDPVER